MAVSGGKWGGLSRGGIFCRWERFGGCEKRSTAILRIVRFDKELDINESD